MIVYNTTNIYYSTTIPITITSSTINSTTTSNESVNTITTTNTNNKQYYNNIIINIITLYSYIKSINTTLMYIGKLS